MLNGVYEGNSPANLSVAEQWLGSNLGAVDAFSGGSSWSDFETSIGYEQGLWAGSGKTALWSIPLFADGGNLKSAAQGSYNAYYVQAAEELVQGQSSGSIYVRTGWEFNSTWQPWSALTDPSDYVSAFQQFVDAFRSVSNRFVFTWAPNIGDQGMNPAAAYPGNAYVDIIGMDFYWETQYDSSNPATAWNTMVNQTYGLNWLAQFAAQQGKPIAIPEWGVESDNAAPYIQQAVAWFNAHNVIYQTYWDSNASYQGQLSQGQYPDAAAAFAAALQPPTVAGVSAAGAGGATTLQAGGTATITVTLSDIVTVAGKPVLTLSDGETAVYTGGSGTTSLTFAYTATTGHTASDLQVTGLELPSGASVADSAGNAISGSVTGDLHLGVNAPAPPPPASAPASAPASVPASGSSAAASPSPVHTDAALTHDFDGDGKADLLWTNASGEISEWSSSHGSGPAGFVDMGNVSTAWQAQGIGDFDGDGKADVLWHNSNGEVGVWESTKGTGSASFVELGNVSTAWQIQGVGDFDGDGKADVLWRNNSGEVGVWESTKGTGSASFVDLGNVSTAWHVAGVGDFDGDGKSDVLWHNNSGEIGVWESTKGVGSASFVDLGAPASGWQIAGVGDFDGDGKSDVLLASSGGELGLWASTKGVGAAGFVDIGPMGANEQVLGVADMNGDGLSDILLRNTTTGDVTAWTSNGSSLSFTAHDLGVAPTTWHPAVDLHIV